VLFDRLTVEEHLWFFAMMKGCSAKRASAEVDKMIQSIGLQDKRTTQARALSGGMKRKLSVGIALIADSKVCFAVLFWALYRNLLFYNAVAECRVFCFEHRFIVNAVLC